MNCRERTTKKETMFNTINMKFFFVVLVLQYSTSLYYINYILWRFKIANYNHCKPDKLYTTDSFLKHKPISYASATHCKNLINWRLANFEWAANDGRIAYMINRAQAFLGKACDRTRTHWYTPPEHLGVLFFARLLNHQSVFISKCRQFTKWQSAYRKFINKVM